MTGLSFRIVRALANHASIAVTDRVVERMEAQPATLSGDDSCLNTAWEEFCIQVQDEESFDWDGYVQTAKGFIEGELGKLLQHEREAIWLQTDAGWDWLWEIEHPEDAENSNDDTNVKVPCDDSESADFVYAEYLLPRAEDYSNDAIAAFLDSSQRGRYEMDRGV